MTSASTPRARVLITRTRQQASELASAVLRMGAEPILVPTIEVVAPESFAMLDDAIRLLSQSEAGPEDAFDWLIVTSANAVQTLSDRARELACQLRPIPVAAIGPATAKVVVESGLASSLGDVSVPREYVAESLVAMLLARCDAPKSFLIVRAEEARDIVPSQLEAAGHKVRVVPAYRKQTPPETLPMLRRIFAKGAATPDVITFTSSSTARNLIELLASIGLRISAGIALASIGPITSATLRELGYEPTFEAEQSTIQSLAAAIAKHLHLD